jgi:hypothetical protein
VADPDRVKALVRELYAELGLAEMPKKKKKTVRVEYEPGPSGGEWMVDYDDDDVEIHRRLLPARHVVHGLVSTEDVLPQQREMEIE